MNADQFEGIDDLRRIVELEEENDRLRRCLKIISVCTYENFNLSEVVNIAKDALAFPPCIEKGMDDDTACP